MLGDDETKTDSSIIKHTLPTTVPNATNSRWINNRRLNPETAALKLEGHATIVPHRLCECHKQIACFLLNQSVLAGCSFFLLLLWLKQFTNLSGYLFFAACKSILRLINHSFYDRLKSNSGPEAIQPEVLLRRFPPCFVTVSPLSGQNDWLNRLQKKQKTKNSSEKLAITHL